MDDAAVTCENGMACLMHVSVMSVGMLWYLADVVAVCVCCCDG